MKQDNSTMQKALEWWNKLPYISKPYELPSKERLTSKYFKKISSFLTSEDITHIFLSEHPEQAVKEVDNSKEGDILEGITGIKWHIDGLTVRDDRNEFVAECMSKNGNIKEDYANARLISKAPELAKENTSLKARIDALLEMEKSDAKFLDLCIKLKARIVLLEDALKLIATTGQPDKDGYISINKATFNLAKEALNQK